MEALLIPDSLAFYQETTPTKQFPQRKEAQLL